MKINIVNANNDTVGDLELNDESSAAGSTRT